MNSKTINYNLDLKYIKILDYVIYNRADKSYLLFKFENLLNEDLLRFTLKIDVFNKADELIETVYLTIDDKYNKKSIFIPDKKLSVSTQTAYIKVQLICARFTKTIFNTNIETEKEIDIKNKITSYDVMHLRPIKAVLVLTRTFMFLFIGLLIVGLYYYVKRDAKIFTYGNSDYIILNGDVYLYKINTKTEYFDLPKSVTAKSKFNSKEYLVKGVYKNALKGSNVTVFKFNSESIIFEDAFNASKIKKIEGGDYVTMVGDRAFKDAKDLNLISFPNATYCARNSFENCINVKEILIPNASVAKDAFKNTNASLISFDHIASSSSLTSLFSCNSVNIKNLNINERIIDNNYFANCKIEKLTIGEKTEIIYGSLMNKVDNCTFDEEHEYLDGFSVSTK
jgi:hypothetical protein